MTFIEPLIVTVNKSAKATTGYRRLNLLNSTSNSMKTAGSILDTWQKMEDQSGITYYWNKSPFASPASNRGNSSNNAIKTRPLPQPMMINSSNVAGSIRIAVRDTADIIDGAPTITSNGAANQHYSSKENNNSNLVMHSVAKPKTKSKHKKKDAVLADASKRKIREKSATANGLSQQQHLSTIVCSSSSLADCSSKDDQMMVIANRCAQPLCSQSNTTATTTTIDTDHQKQSNKSNNNIGCQPPSPQVLIWSAAPDQTTATIGASNYHQPNQSSSSSPYAYHRHHSSSATGAKLHRAQRFLHSLVCCIRADHQNNQHGKHRSTTTIPSTTPKGTVDGNSSSGMLSDRNNTTSMHPYSPKASEKLLLPPIRPCDINKKCLIIDLDETLVHSSFKPVKNPDFVIPVEIDGVVHQVYVLKRPYVDEFLERIGDKFECILFTASLAKYADPVADLLDKRHVFRSRLFRESCVFHKGNYVKDLNRLGRDLKRVIIVDNSPASYAFHPDNAIGVQSWFDDQNDVELIDIIPLLDQLANVDNIYNVLRNSNESSPLLQQQQLCDVSSNVAVQHERVDNNNTTIVIGSAADGNSVDTTASTIRR